MYGPRPVDGVGMLDGPVDYLQASLLVCDRIVIL